MTGIVVAAQTEGLGQYPVQRVPTRLHRYNHLPSEPHTLQLSWLELYWLAQLEWLL